MMVLFVSQCEKKALKRTRRVLDSFADRIGNNTWRTVITSEGLQAVHKLLRKTASKSTAVSCHWLRSRSRSDLLWVVGKRNRFDSRGNVPVNFTTHPPINTDWENNWQYAASIQIMATLAALFHDIGKSSRGFQGKLFSEDGFSADPLRHEWISLRLFEWLLEDVKSDSEWLERFSDLESYLKNKVLPFENWDASAICRTGIAHLPPLAQWLGWLIVTHHRMPFYDVITNNPRHRKQAQKGMVKIERTLSGFYNKLEPVDYWVKNPRIMEKTATREDFWSFKKLVIHSTTWQYQVKRWTKKALAYQPLMDLAGYTDSEKTVSDPLLLHLSRLSLMLGDYTYSSMLPEDPRRLRGDKDFHDLAANTYRLNGKTPQCKQMLDEHLLGVAARTARFAHLLPGLSTQLPTLRKHDPLLKPTGIRRFTWQNKAYKLACSLQKSTVEQGFFGINMASTGCGKTIGNARILYGLADPQKGARFTIALGLRVLTLQTGQSFRKNLGLTDAELAILVGGCTDHIQQDREDNKDQLAASVEEESGSASAEKIVQESVDSAIDSEFAEHYQKEFKIILEKQKDRALLFAPVVACTIDHLMQASECSRGGRYILPWLRLLTSDIILDEPDDFSQEDLPALARFVHLAGLCGARIMLSSATLAPDFVIGLFEAYQAGRIIWNKSQKRSSSTIVCAWFDEKSCQDQTCIDKKIFSAAHQKFIQKRVVFLKASAKRRIGAILPIKSVVNWEKPGKFYQPLAKEMLDAALSLHHQYHEICSETGQTYSIGLLRMANIAPLMKLATACYAIQMNPKQYNDVHFHLCCYHARQLLCLRNGLEEKLDRILQRDEENPEGILAHPEIRKALAQYPARHHVFIVLASPVAEIGRDHDYDWAITEPSSMRSLIQLAGRIWRHRPSLVAKLANILIWQYNIRALEAEIPEASFSAFFHPGFEDNDHLLTTHDCEKLLISEQLAHINAAPRIQRPEKPLFQERLSDLEHQVIAELLNNEETNFVNGYWKNRDTANRSHVHLQRISPFRASIPEEEWLFIPESDDNFSVYAAEQVYRNGLQASTCQNHLFRPFQLGQVNQHLSPWLTGGLFETITELHRNHQDKSFSWIASRYARVQLPISQNGWNFHEWFGFWKID